MAPTSFKALKAALESGTFAPVYLFFGADDHLKDENVRALITRATDPSTRDFNCDVLRAGEIDLATLSGALEALPMLAARRLVVLRDPGAMKKPLRERLDRYLQKPAPEVILLMVSPSGAKAEASLVAAAECYEFTALEGDALRKWIAHESRTANRVGISDGAATRLATYGGNDLALLAGELRKLAAFTDGGEITEAAVEAVTGVRPGVSLGDLLDHAAMRDTMGAVALVEDVLAQPKQSGVTTVMALGAQVLAIGWGVAARGRGMPAHQLEREYFTLLKEAGNAFTGRSWSDAVKCWARAVPKWSRADVERALPHLLAADAALKDTKVSSEAQIVVSLLLAITPPMGRRQAA